MFDYYDFARELLTEYSEYDPIPELRQQENLAIFLVGPAGSGKTYFINNFVKKHQPDLYRFSSDWLSYVQREKDPEHQDKPEGKYIKGTSSKRHKYMKSFLRSGKNENFIFDTTGISTSGETAYSKKVKEIAEFAENQGYDVLFIMIMPISDEALERAVDREEDDEDDEDEPDFDYPDKVPSPNRGENRPRTDVDYVKKTLSKRDDRHSFGSFGEGPPGKEFSVAFDALSTTRAQKTIKTYSRIVDYPMYIVVNIAGSEFVFYKHENGKLKVRKGDKYVPVSQ